jgi:hypothetical protein
MVAYTDGTKIMNPFQEQMRREARSMKLTEVEHRVLKEKILTYVAHRPLARSTSFFEQSPAWFFSSRFVVSITATFFIVTSGGVSFAASHAYPGDTLYFIKLNVNEGVRGLFAFTQRERLAWQVERATRRLEEASVLSFAPTPVSEAGVAPSELAAQTTELKDMLEHFSAKEAPAVAQAHRSLIEAGYAQGVITDTNFADAVLLTAQTLSGPEETDSSATEMAFSAVAADVPKSARMLQDASSEAMMMETEPVSPVSEVPPVGVTYVRDELRKLKGEADALVGILSEESHRVLSAHLRRAENSMLEWERNAPMPEELTAIEEMLQNLSVFVRITSARGSEPFPLDAWLKGE